MKFVNFISLGTLAGAMPQSAAIDGISSRQQTKPVCNTGLPTSASAFAISQRITELKARTDDCGLEPGKCQVLQCASNSGIRWCNHNDHYASWKCRDFWPHAQGILNECSFEGVTKNAMRVWGLEHDIQGFEVQVGSIPC